MLEIPSKLKKGLCVACRCTTDHYKNDRFCGKHRRQYAKENNLAVYVFNKLKSNAKRRGKKFSLTLRQFESFCFKTDYLKRKGKTKKALSIDRVDPNKGYHIDNIQVLTISRNSKKHHAEKQKTPL